jgi:hypothetical protein
LVAAQSNCQREVRRIFGYSAATIIHVLDQDVAKDFYVAKLGVDVKVDATLPTGFRWLTVCPRARQSRNLF